MVGDFRFLALLGMTQCWGFIAVALTFDSSPFKETFAKLSRTVIMCPDSQSLKLHFDIDSRLRGNDGRFCKGLLEGRGDSVGWFGLLLCPAVARHSSGLRIKSAMT